MAAPGALQVSAHAAFWEGRAGQEVAFDLLQGTPHHVLQPILDRKGAFGLPKMLGGSGRPKLCTQKLKSIQKPAISSPSL